MKLSACISHSSICYDDDCSSSISTSVSETNRKVSSKCMYYRRRTKAVHLAHNYHKLFENWIIEIEWLIRFTDSCGIILTNYYFSSAYCQFIDYRQQTEITAKYRSVNNVFWRVRAGRIGRAREPDAACGPPVRPRCDKSSQFWLHTFPSKPHTALIIRTHIYVFTLNIRTWRCAKKHREHHRWPSRWPWPRMTVRSALSRKSLSLSAAVAIGRRALQRPVKWRRQ